MAYSFSAPIASITFGRADAAAGVPQPPLATSAPAAAAMAVAADRRSAPLRDRKAPVVGLLGVGGTAARAIAGM